jgi:8-oxo-dGTP pyrophosphatase MutT (NUDIX family)
MHDADGSQKADLSRASGDPIRIAAALLCDGEGRLLLVRKAGTPWFMQAGGKIECGESPHVALQRELREEIGLTIDLAGVRHLGRFSAMAANEPGRTVEAELFRVPLQGVPVAGSEIAELIWIDSSEAVRLPLAPLTRDHVLPLALGLEGRAEGGA